MSFVLPPLRRQVLRQIIKIVLLFACLGFSLIVIIHESVSDPKILINQNHQITNEVISMLESLDFLHSKAIVKAAPDRLKLHNKFESSLEWFKKNSKVAEEQITIQQVEELWQKHNKDETVIAPNDYITMRQLLIRLIAENQTDVAQTLSHQISFAKRMAFLACIIFLIGLGISIYFSEKLSRSIAQPLRKITEVLQSQPKLHEKLKFPIPTSLEIKVLILELNDLWKRLGELNSKNIQNLESQKREMEAIFSAMEDAAVVIDSQNRVQYYNRGFLDILGLEDEKLILDQKWDDLSLMSDSYLQLRGLIRRENYDEILFTCIINEEDKIYRARKKTVLSSSQNKIGIILLLHDITKKLPFDKFRDTLNTLKINNS